MLSVSFWALVSTSGMYIRKNVNTSYWFGSGTVLCTSTRIPLPTLELKMLLWIGLILTDNFWNVLSHFWVLSDDPDTIDSSRILANRTATRLCYCHLDISCHIIIYLSHLNAVWFWSMIDKIKFTSKKQMKYNVNLANK